MFDNTALFRVWCSIRRITNPSYEDVNATPAFTLLVGGVDFSMSDDTRTRILAAAGPIFAEKGFQAATVREICRAAGVNLASVNYYFGDKETLYIEAVKLARCLRTSQAPMPELSDDMPPEQRLRLFVQTMVTRMVGIENVSWQSQLMMHEMLRPTKACQAMVEEFLRPEFNMLLKILAELLPEDVPHHDLHHAGFSIIGQCLFYRVAGDIVRFIVSPDEFQRRYTVEQLTDHIYRMSLAGLAGVEAACVTVRSHG
jgi:AcrR family transcriptional regulator